VRESPVLLRLEDGSLRPSPGGILARQLRPIDLGYFDLEQKTLHPWILRLLHANDLLRTVGYA
jgi:hypothetical protein